MNEHYFIATGLALLAIAAPALLIAWGVWDARRHPTGADASASLWRPAERRISLRFVWAAFFTAIALAFTAGATWIATSAASSHDARQALTLWAAAGGLMAVAPFWPISGPLAYIVVSYTMPRDDAITKLLFSAEAEWLLTSLSVAALVAWACRNRIRPAPPRAPAIWALLAFTCWVGVAVLAAMWNDHPIDEGLVHRTGRILQCTVLCLTAYYALPSVQQTQLMAMAIAMMLGLRAARFTGGVRLEQNLAALVAIAIPWMLGVAWSLRSWLRRLAVLPLAIGLMVLVLYIANRGAFLGLLGGAVAVWVTSRWRWRWAAAAAPLLLGGALMLPQTSVGQRLDEAYAEGMFQESAQGRIELWTAAVAAAREYPIAGVGPENYAHYFASYYGEEYGIGAHNIFLDVVAETGFPGLLCFIAVWCCATATLARALVRAGHSREKHLLLGALAALWVYLVTGFFLSLASLTFIYILMGLGLALAANLDHAEAAAAVYRGPTGAASTLIAPAARHFDVAALIFSGLVILGSLTPFEFAPVGPTEASRRFLSLGWLPTGHISRVDVVSNFMLFVPLGFLATGSLTCDRRGVTWKLIAVFLTVAGCAAIGAGIEYAQCWFPSRTVSAQDVVAQAAGATVGALCWSIIGQKAVSSWRSWRIGRVELSKVQIALVAYGFAWLVWDCWPLEITLHPVELWHKYRAGYIALLPSHGTASLWADGVDSLLVIFLLVAPIGWLIAGAWTPIGQDSRDRRVEAALAMALGFGIECARVMSQGRSASLVQCCVTIAGMLFGCFIYRRSRQLMFARVRGRIG